MIIELVGPPGSGKSTLARTLEETTPYKKVRVSSKHELLWLNIIFFFKYPLFCIKTLFLVTKHSSSVSMFYYKFMNIYLHHNARYEKAKKLDKTIIDEGLTHNVLGIFDEQTEEKSIYSYIKSIPPSDHVLIINTPKETIKKQLEERGHMPRETFYTKERWEKWLDNTIKNTNTLEEVLEKQNIPHSNARDKNLDEIKSLLL
ncbi:hypothetical protein CL654_02775 [bacterium]|nr:hypothetical protein [bacterium]|tara:strand:+ start:5323 stop:5928 length:606 start_codon:yes stop_codon:yes gene_type:complete